MIRKESRSFHSSGSFFEWDSRTRLCEHDHRHRTPQAVTGDVSRCFVVVVVVVVVVVAGALLGLGG